jgi:hypothetical protein
MLKYTLKIYTNICSNKNQANPQNVGALQKNRRIWKMLAFSRKIGGSTKCWRLSEI